MHRILWPAVGLSFAVAATAPAQQTHVIPNGMATAAGGTANTFPWGSTGGASPGIRVLACYDSGNFTDAGIDYPVRITRLRWRADDSAQTWTGGSYAQATISLSTAQVDYSAVSTTWSANHGGDLTLCHSGPVAVQPGTGTGPGLPGPFHVDVPLTTPFVYDPAQGDLCIDCEWQNGAWTGGSRSPLDVDDRPAGRASRVFASSQYPNANGTTQNHGVVVEVTYDPAFADTATAFPYGAGCNDGFASFYELFPPGTFDLVNSGFRLLPTTAGGYAAFAGAPSWFTPVSAPIAMAGNGVSPAQPLGFSFPFPGGSTSAIHISSNGFVWAAPNFDNGCCVPTPGELLSLPARWAALWADLDPSSGGAVHFDVDPPANAAYVTFVNVPEAGNPTSTSTFQIAFYLNGTVDYRYQQCAVNSHVTLVGFSPGNGARDPGAMDLTASMPFVTQPDLFAPVLAAGARPLVNTSVPIGVSGLPANAPIGAFYLALVQYDPGLSLTAVGMPGCEQLVALGNAILFVPGNGAGSILFSIPNDPGFSGVHVYLQAAAFSPGANPLGVVNSNGVDLHIGTQ